MYKLLRGVNEFRRNEYPKREKLFNELSQGQNPLALFITCSDSRINPNLITNSEPGELFLLRNAGNLVPNYDQGLGEAATIEYAVKVLKVKDIIVCGHTLCGAMAALLDPKSCEGLPAVAAWTEGGRAMADRVRGAHPEATGDALWNLVIEENVKEQINSLKGHPAVSDALAEDVLSLHGWIYCIASGEVLVFDPQQHAFHSADAVANKT